MHIAACLPPLSFCLSLCLICSHTRDTCGCSQVEKNQQTSQVITITGYLGILSIDLPKLHSAIRDLRLSTGL